jgi:hypothetical protein
MQQMKRSKITEIYEKGTGGKLGDVKSPIVL